ncbi:MAG: alpha/beta fold hydrolase [Panacagrimonas sp.]
MATGGAAALNANVHAMGLDSPVDLVGNSLGGHLALTMAREGWARSVVALSPGGLWKGDKAPARVRGLLNLTRAAVKYGARVTETLIRTRAGRSLAFAIPLSSHAGKIPATEALAITRCFARAAAFDETLAAVSRFSGGRDITTPITIAFGTRDWLLTRDCQYHDELPEHARWLHPAGWGHVPMWDDPQRVADLILEGSAQARAYAGNARISATGKRIEKSVIFIAASTRPRARSGNTA